jgi:hypothetical protein
MRRRRRRRRIRTILVEDKPSNFFTEYSGSLSTRDDASSGCG